MRAAEVIATSADTRTVPAVTPQMTVTAERGTDPRNTFLTLAEVMFCYGWGRTKGYELMRERLDGFPPAVAGRYQLDTLFAWEGRQLAAAGWDDAPTDPAPGASAVASPHSPRQAQARPAA